MELFPNPGTLKSNLLYSPFPTSGNKKPSISSDLLDVYSKPELSGALIITKDAPLSSFGISSFGAYKNTEVVKTNMVIKKIIISFFLFNQNNNVLL